MFNKINFTRYARWIFISTLCGVLAGLAASVFLYTLDWATSVRDKNTAIIWFLPFAGLLIGWVYFRWGWDVSHGNNLILDEIHDPKNIVPFKMTPLILGGTILTHLFGGSAGREGTAVQMGASLSDQLSRYFRIENAERKILLMAGAGAGFGAAIGTPWAGAIFGMEVIHVSLRKFRPSAWVECFIAAFAGYYTAILLGSPHSKFPAIVLESFNIKILLWVAIAGAVFGVAAKLFILLTHFVEKINSKWISYPPLRPFVFGLLIVLLFYFEGSYRYVGLGIPVIQDALVAAGNFFDPALKTFFTALTVGSGFKGGEFIPLVFIGTTLGSAMSLILPVSFQLLAAVGFAAVFAGASKTPIACSVMAIEIFGAQIAPFVVVACFMSYYFSGSSSIYRSQR